MHTIHRFFALLFIAFFFYAPAAAFSVDGLVLNDEDEPEAYATLRVCSTADSTRAVAQATASAGGSFSISLPSAGTYRITASAVGLAPASAEFTVSDDAPSAHIEALRLSFASEALNGIEVVAQRPLVTKEIDRIGYDVQGDEESKTASTQDILRKVPMVTVDSDGTIKINGSSDFKIYKNGRPNNTFTRNAKDIFRSIPASTIKKIEVITDPGAREDAEGVATILNIVTLQSTSIKGVMASLSLSASTSSLTPAPFAMVMTQIDKVTLSVNGGFHHSGGRANKSKSESESVFDDSGNRLYSSSRTDHRNASSNSGYLSVEGSYDIDSLNLLTVELSGWSYGGDNPSFSSTDMSDADGNTLYSYDSYTRRNHNSYIDFSGSVNYQHSTQRKGETITLSYLISNSESKSDLYQEYYNLVNPLFDYNGIAGNSRERFTEHTGQFDWTRPINDKHRFDIGAKFIFRDNRADGNRRYLLTDDERVTPTDYSHLTSVGAAYFDWRSKFGRFTLRGGLRYEYSKLTSKDRIEAGNNFSSSLNDWVPMAAINYTINDAQSIKISYNSRINRPQIYALNPTTIVTPTSVRYGNPNLSSSMRHSFTLNYNIIKRKINADISATYYFSNNGVHNIQWVENTDGTDISYSTYGNIGRTRTWRFNAYMRWSITGKTSLMVNGGASHNSYTYRSPDLHLARWGGNYYVQLRQQLPLKVNLEIWHYAFVGGASSVYSYSRFSSSMLRYGFNLHRNFLKDDRLSVRLSVSNPFGPYSTKYESHTLNSGATGTSTSHRYNECYGSISLSYRFGSLNAYVKKTKRSVSNDDISRSRPGN